MIEIRIPKEIREYKEKIMLGLSLRQIIAVGLLGVVSIGLFFAFSFLGTEFASIIAMIGAAPFGAWGFVKIGGMDIEEFVKMFIMNNFILPTNRVYETENVFEQVADIIREKQFSEIKVDFLKTMDAEKKKLQSDEKKLRLKRKISNSAKTVVSKSKTLPVEKEEALQEIIGDDNVGVQFIEPELETPVVAENLPPEIEVVEEKILIEEPDVVEAPVVAENLPPEIEVVEEKIIAEEPDVVEALVVAEYLPPAEVEETIEVPKPKPTPPAKPRMTKEEKERKKQEEKENAWKKNQILVERPRTTKKKADFGLKQEKNEEE